MFEFMKVLRTPKKPGKAFSKLLKQVNRCSGWSQIMNQFFLPWSQPWNSEDIIYIIFRLNLTTFAWFMFIVTSIELFRYSMMQVGLWNQVKKARESPILYRFPDPENKKEAKLDIIHEIRSQTIIKFGVCHMLTNSILADTVVYFLFFPSHFRIF